MESKQQQKSEGRSAVCMYVFQQQYKKEEKNRNNNK